MARSLEDQAEHYRRDHRALDLGEEEHPDTKGAVVPRKNFDGGVLSRSTDAARGKQRQSDASDGY